MRLESLAWDPPNAQAVGSATAGVATATLAALTAANLRNTYFVVGFRLSVNLAVVLAGTLTITGLVGGTQTYLIPVGWTGPLVVEFRHVRRATAQTAVVMSCTSLGAGVTCQVEIEALAGAD